MTCEGNQCCARTPDNKRCSNSVYHDSNHCKTHYPKAIKLYKEYKKICNVAYDLDIDQEKGPDIEKDIRYYLKCYIWLNRAFDARMKHRKYAFVPECYDYGHDKQFDIIQEKLNKCELVLSNLYNEYKKQNQLPEITPPPSDDSDNGGNTMSITDESDTDETTEDNNKYAVTIVPKKIKKYNKKRKEKTENIDQIISQYMKENKIELERRNKLINIILKTITMQYQNIINVDDDNIFILTMTMHHITKILYEIGYYEENYKPERCKECCCGNYICYDMKLGCGCYYRYDHVKEYLNVMSEYTLRMFLEIMLRNQEKIKPLLTDMIWFYQMFGESILTMEMETIWDDKKNRLILRVAEILQDKKPSKNMARLRMKKKALQRLIESEERMSDSDSDSDSE